MAKPRFSPQLAGELTSRVRGGATLLDAAAQVGVNPNTANAWAKRGRKEEGTAYAVFASELVLAREQAAAERMSAEDLIGVLERAARNGSVAAAKFLIERIDRERTRNEAPEAEEGADPSFDELAARRTA